MTDALTALNTAVPSLDWLTITDRASGAITAEGPGDLPDRYPPPII
jgi:hypothetical protein